MDTVLEELIEEKGFRKGFIAQLAGMHPSQLSRLLHSERDPKLPEGAAAVIAERLGVPAETFFDGQRLRMRKAGALEQQNAPPPGQRQALPANGVKDGQPATGAGTPTESALSGTEGA